MELTHFSLFTGIGGIDLAAERAGFKTVGQCEFADFPTKVLEKHWPDVPRWRDIRDVTAESFYEYTGLRTADLISGGFPCQPFSLAGNKKGKEDSRYLWPEMLRVIRELTPRWVVGENVPGILRIAGQAVCEDLERAGYSVAVFNFEAAAVGVPHRRERIFFVANSDNRGGAMRGNREFPAACEAQGTGRNYRGGAQEYVTGERREAEPGLGGVDDGFSYWLHEPDGVPRIATDVPNRADRLKCLGNAVVPQQVYPILAAIARIEQEMENEHNTKAR